MSVVDKQRDELERQGEYVIRANANSGWFAVFPKKVDSCRSVAQGRGRSDFNLLVYRTKTGDEHDHFVIPFSQVASQFVNESLTHSKVNGTTRWNCTLQDGVLHVSHTGQSVDVSQFHREALISARGRSDTQLPEEVSEGETFTEGSVIRITINRYERDPDARQRCISLHGSICSICKFDFVAVYGECMAGFIHVHHLAPLHQIGADYAVNPATDLIPVCPNCHAVIHSKRQPLASECVRELLEDNSEPTGRYKVDRANCCAAANRKPPS